MDSIKNIFAESLSVLNEFSNETNFKKIEDAGRLMAQSVKNGGKIISCGNGGSMSDAMHFAEELTGFFRDVRPAIPAIAISDPSFLTCTGNDFGYDVIFSRFVDGIGSKGDTLLAISTSGNSKNVINATHSAKNKGMHVVALTGKDGGELKNLADIEIRVPHFGYADRIQEVHIKIIHALISIIEKEVQEE